MQMRAEFFQGKRQFKGQEREVPFYEKLKEYLSLVLCGKDTKDEMRSMYEKLFSIYIINRRLRKGLKLFRLKKEKKRKKHS